MPRDKNAISWTLFIAVAVCLVCSVFVSWTAVKMKPLQDLNKELERKRNILSAAGLLEAGTDVAAEFGRIDTRLVDLATGEYVTDQNAAAFDPLAAARDPERNVTSPTADDLAGIKRRARLARVYLLRERGELKRVILPIYGKGLWSTLYGFIALESDLDTVCSLAFYQHGETPGLGGEVDNPAWKAQWVGKEAFADGRVAIEVVKGKVVAGSPRAIHQVDGLSGATITSRGVSQLVRYWLGENGFGPYLDRLREEVSHG
jgi:Na+-transporting NADH:ubiquinone oxidoreductase subunit C